MTEKTWLQHTIKYVQPETSVKKISLQVPFKYKEVLTFAHRDWKFVPQGRCKFKHPKITVSICAELICRYISNLKLCVLNK